MTYKGVKTFFCEPVQPLTRRIFLRRYVSESEGADKCPGKHGYHQAMTFLRDEGFEWDTSDRGSPCYPPVADEVALIANANWPTKCEACPFIFQAGHYKQVFQDRLYRRVDTGLIFALRDITPGGLFYDEYDGRLFNGSDAPGPDGKYLIVVCPNGRRWNIDSRASNCTKKDDNKHKCWVRHGDPREGKLHVDKNGVTCQAGAGSIVAGDYHGFLHNGSFTDG